LDRGSRNYDNYFGRTKGTKRDHEGTPIVSQFDLIEAATDDFNLIDVAINEALPDTIECCCGEEFKKTKTLVRLFRGHTQNFCPIFAALRQSVIELKVESK
jgi:hypothetical protein